MAFKPGDRVKHIAGCLTGRYATVITLEDIKKERLGATVGLKGTIHCWSSPEEYLELVRPKEILKEKGLPIKEKSFKCCDCCGGSNAQKFSWPPWTGPLVYGHKPGCRVGTVGSKIC